MNHEQVKFSGVDPFYDFMHHLWMKVSEARLNINETNEHAQRCKRLEDWYEALDMLFTSIMGFLNDEEINSINVYISDIEKKTSNDFFYESGLNSQDFKEIKRLVRQMQISLFQLMAKYKLLLPTQEVIVYSSFQEQAEAENI